MAETWPIDLLELAMSCPHIFVDFCILRFHVLFSSSCVILLQIASGRLKKDITSGTRSGGSISAMSSSDEFEFADFSEEDLRTIDCVADAAFATDSITWPQSSSSSGLTTNLGGLFCG